MYSPTVTAAAIERIESTLNTKLIRYEPAQSLEYAAYFTRLHSEHKFYASNGSYLNRAHAEFVRNERILCQQDFYYFLRYCVIERDGVEGGGVGQFYATFWESQQILLNLIAKLEVRNQDYHARGYPCDGILICDNKGGRQLGHTMIARALTLHRLVMHPHTRALGASVDEDKVGELYTRDKLLLDNLPFFLRPSGYGVDGFDKKNEHIQFADEHGSRILYQHAKQQSGLGTGRQFDVSHMTEVSQWPNPRMIEIDFLPTIPQHPYSFCLLETTPQGRKNWWFQWSEKVRHGRMPRWAYLYIPWYSEPRKYRRHMPDGWKPNEHTMQMAWKVFNTSQEFVGKQTTLTRDQLGWWETSYNEAIENGSLNLFLSNYSITPEMSFQHTSVSAINALTLDWMRMGTTSGIPYELEGV